MSAPAVDDAETLALVRQSVQKVLTRSPSYRALDPVARQQMAHDMVRVARYVVDANGDTAGTPMNATISTGLADAGPGDVKNRDLGKTSGQLWGGAQAGTAGVNNLGSAVKKVDFPGFVSGLVEGVFSSIVTSSIRQMEAYGTLVANVAKSVDEYMRDNVTENQARDYLAGKYPGHIKVDATGKNGPKAVTAKTAGRGGPGASRGRRGGAMEAGLDTEAFAGPEQMPMPDFMKDLGLSQPVTRLDDKTVENTLVPAARRRMAMDRQQLLATMVLMGINRLIVTDGKISASCLFQLDTTDSITAYSESASDYDEHRSQEGPAWSWLFWSGGKKSSSANFNVSTSSDAESETTSKLHAELAGNVEINFRSDVVSLDKIADSLQMKEIEAKAPAAAPAPPPQQQPGVPGMTLPPPPPFAPLPAMPGAPAAPVPAPAAGG